MNVWRLTAANNLVLEEENFLSAEGRHKVRVTKVFLGEADAKVFSGACRVKYPRVPGRYAVGIVADETSEHYTKGARVLLHALLPREDTGTEKCDFSQTMPLVCGRTAEGYLRDFVAQSERDMTLLPDSVNDEKALLVQHIALAKAAIERLHPQKGDHIAVIGADLVGLFAAQLLIYQQVAPILIDARQERLDFARTCGVYYALPDGEGLLERLGSITGGRLADGVLCSADPGSQSDPALPFTVCAQNKNVVICGDSGQSLPVDLGPALDKQLTVSCVSDGTDYIETAINLIANKAIDLEALHAHMHNAGELTALLKDLLSNPRPLEEIDIVNML